MKFGIIGAGMIGHFHAKAIQSMSGSSLHSVFDLRPESAEKLAREYGGKAFSEFAAFLADPELEVVTIGTPSGAHRDPAIAALQAGKHVICEKPLEITTERIDEMIAAAQASGKTLSAVLNRRFQPAIEALKKASDENRFGRITSASAYIKWWRTQEYYDSGAWRGTWALDGGGALMNQGVHTVDQLLHIAGPVVAVTASTALLAHERIEVEDSCVAILEFASGARGVIEASTCCWSSGGHPAEVQVCGTNGSVFLADECFRVWDFADPGPADKQIHETMMQGSVRGLGANDPTAIHFDGHRRNFQEVVSAIQENRPCAVDATEARKAVALINAVYRSAREGGTRIVLST